MSLLGQNTIERGYFGVHFCAAFLARLLPRASARHCGLTIHTIQGLGSSRRFGRGSLYRRDLEDWGILAICALDAVGLKYAEVVDVGAPTSARQPVRDGACVVAVVGQTREERCAK